MIGRSVAVLLAVAVAAGCVVAQSADKKKAAAPPEGVPAGYTLKYQQDFKTADALKDFVYTDPNAWRHSLEKEGGRGSMELFARSKYKYKVRSPFNISLVKDKKFGSFVLDAELTQTGKEYGHRDMCLFFNFQDPSHFYYVHISSTSDAHAHQIFIVNDKPRTKITTEGTKGHKWSSKPWHKIRIVRDIESGKIEIYANDLAKPIMKATDKTFGAGYLGFGSFDDTGKISLVRVWAKEVEDKKVEFFKSKP
jgi:hypothetical protein